MGIAFGAGDLQEFGDESGEALDLFLDAVEGGVAVGSGAGEFDGELEASERGAEFMGDVLQEAALGSEEGLDALGHNVERLGEFAEFILR